MRVLEETVCKFCDNIFCCSECRRKHEIKNHAIAFQKSIIIPSEQNKSAAENVKCKNTVSDKVYLFCPICEKRPLVLKPEIHKEILLHIDLRHLPLRCQKCLKTYSNINDMKEFSKCVSQSNESVSLNQSCFTDEASKATVTKTALPQLNLPQSSPHEFNESHITPISIINMCWKAKSKLQHEEFISDSVSSIKNISSISNSSSRRGSGMASSVKGKVIRCSSTPVHLEMVFAKPKEQTFNATSGHMSSIQYNSGCESEASPAFSQPSSQALEPVNRYVKAAGSRPRMTAVTPLRQVMSKSIQKAFAEHGIPPTNTGKISYTFQRKNIFDSNSSPEVDDQQSPAHPALDLRLSPAVRRSQSESVEAVKYQSSFKKESNELPYLRREILLSAQKLTTESIVITRTEHLSSVSSSTSSVSSNFSMNSVKSNPMSTNSSYESACNSAGSSVFKSCSSVEIITATTKEIKKMQSFDEENIKNTALQSHTPISRVPGSVIHKKIIKFETPRIELSESRQSQSSPNEEFFTPNATPSHYNKGIESPQTSQRKVLVKQNLNQMFSTLQRPSIRECAHSTAFSRIENMTNGFDDLHESENDNDEVFLSHQPEKASADTNCDKNENLNQKQGGLWALMTSVMRLPSLKGKVPKDPSKNDASIDDSGSSSMIKRCASIAGSLVRSKSLADEKDFPSLKRKRTYTTDNQSTSSYLAGLKCEEAISPTSNLNISSKRFRIQGRRPIDRMRLNS